MIMALVVIVDVTYGSVTNIKFDFKFTDDATTLTPEELVLGALHY